MTGDTDAPVLVDPNGPNTDCGFYVVYGVKVVETEYGSRHFSLFFYSVLLRFIQESSKCYSKS